MIKTNVKLPTDYSEADIIDRITAALPVSRDEIGEVTVVRRTLNVKDKENVHYDMTVAFCLSSDREESLLKLRKRVSVYPDMTFAPPPACLPSRPVVVGAGPAGLFAALILAESGARPVLYERGLSVEERESRVRLFTTLGMLDPECNIQYGEGGAGTYSDGKLKAGAPDKYKLKVLSEFVHHGAPEDIMYSSSAHVGTDKLSHIVRSIRERIISLGGEVHFAARLIAIDVSDKRLVGGRVEKNGEIIDFSTNDLILATGHSAKDVFELLSQIGAPMEARGFGIGMRIEHPREYIDRLIYGNADASRLGAASYHLVTHLPTGRSVYSFCMCPGGTVAAAASERGGIVTNGMSEYKRDGENSNAAILVSVTPDDFSGDVFSGIALQRSIERRAFAITSGTYRAPAQRLDAFMKGRADVSFAGVKPSYPIGVERVKAEKYLPEYVTDSMRLGLLDFDAWLPGFMYPEATLTGPETRTTSPVRVLRGEDFMSLTVNGLYPIGEGAGYSGGIVSSARDGVMCAEAILEKYKKTP
ncbi:MAG: hypothetical protein IJY69_06440 [Clostridia bacterium]|nr:hypothetical protein [Clostridia bacterium]